MSMLIEDLIKKLEELPKEQEVVKGFTSPHSYRGYYECLAFEPCEDTTVGAMLNSAKEGYNNVYQGYKGGKYKMTDGTECYLAFYGSIGEEMGETLLDYMLGLY